MSKTVYAHLADLQPLVGREIGAKIGRAHV